MIAPCVYFLALLAGAHLPAAHARSRLFLRTHNATEDLSEDRDRADLDIIGEGFSANLTQSNEALGESEVAAVDNEAADLDAMNEVEDVMNEVDGRRSERSKVAASETTNLKSRKAPKAEEVSEPIERLGEHIPEAAQPAHEDEKKQMNSTAAPEIVHAKEVAGSELADEVVADPTVREIWQNDAKDGPSTKSEVTTVSDKAQKELKALPVARPEAKNDQAFFGTDEEVDTDAAIAATAQEVDADKTLAIKRANLDSDKQMEQARSEDSDYDSTALNNGATEVADIGSGDTEDAADSEQSGNGGGDDAVSESEYSEDATSMESDEKEVSDWDGEAPEARAEESPEAEAAESEYAKDAEADFHVSEGAEYDEVAAEEPAESHENGASLDGEGSFEDDYDMITQDMDKPEEAESNDDGTSIEMDDAAADAEMS